VVWAAAPHAVLGSLWVTARAVAVAAGLRKRKVKGVNPLSGAVSTPPPPSSPSN
jgi:hypothetical protein